MLEYLESKLNAYFDIFKLIVVTISLTVSSYCFYMSR